MAVTVTSRRTRNDNGNRCIRWSNQQTSKSTRPPSTASDGWRPRKDIRYQDVYKCCGPGHLVRSCICIKRIRFRKAGRKSGGTFFLIHQTCTASLTWPWNISWNVDAIWSVSPGRENAKSASNHLNRTPTRKMVDDRWMQIIQHVGIICQEEEKNRWKGPDAGNWTKLDKKP